MHECHTILELTSATFLGGHRIFPTGRGPQLQVGTVLIFSDGEFYGLRRAMGNSINGGTQNGWFIMEHPFKMDYFVVPPF